ncbi:unnamed protein product [Closterium sp. NIES-53]
MWLNDLQLYLLSDSKDSVSLFDLAPGTAPAPPATAGSAIRSQWLTRDATARLAIRNHLPLAECTHFRQHRTAQALYTAVVARYSSPATAALGRLLLPYLFPELSAFATVEDLVSHLHTSGARYRATVPAEDHFLSLDPTSLTADLLEQHLLAAKTSAVAVGAARGTPRPPFSEGCSPSPLAPSYVRAASASAKRGSGKGKGSKGGGGGSGSDGGGSSGGGGGSGGGDSGGSGGGGGGVGGCGGGSSGSGGSGTGGGGTSALTERHEPVSRPVWPIRTARRAPRSRPPHVPDTHAMALRPSSVPLRVSLRDPPESSLPEVPDPESDRTRAASPTVSRLLATTVTDPSFESAAASALVAEQLDFAATCHLDYATALVAESASASPPSVEGECALGMDILEDRQEDFECLAAAVPRFASMLLAPEGDPDAPDILTPRSYAEAIMGPYSSQWQAAIDAEMASWKSTGTYVDEVPPPRANIVDVMWIFRVKRPPGSPPAFKARYVARGFSQQKGVDYFQTFSPTPKITTLRVLLHVAAQRDYELHSLDFSIAFLQGSLHKGIWLRRPPGFTGSFPAGTQWSLRRPVYGLRQAPREWHNTLRTTLAALGFAPSIAYPSLFLRTDTSLPPFYILVYVYDLVFATANTEALPLVKSELQKRHTCTDLGGLRSYLGLQITRDRARRTITLT